VTRYRFHTLDVFTTHRSVRNPLAVVLNADALSGERMQAIAAEFNLSENRVCPETGKVGCQSQEGSPYSRLGLNCRSPAIRRWAPAICWPN